MTMTYTVAADRDRQRQQRVSWRPEPRWALIAASVVVIVAIALAYTGRFRALSASSQGREDAIVNLNTVRDAAELEPALAALYTHPDDRRFAARALFEFLTADPDRSRSLPNVGAVARATASAEAILGARSLQTFAARLSEGATRPAAAGAPRTIPLFTAADIATLKPYVTVRTRADFRNRVLWWTGLYILAFHAVTLAWRLRHRRSDGWLLATVHLLTGIGFAVLVSRPDPLRDSLLFVRYAETTIAGVALMGGLSLLEFSAAGFGAFSFLPLLAALSLSVLLILFGSGPGHSSAKVNLGPIQPIEAIRLLLALFLAGYFARRWELLREVRRKTVRGLHLPSWINVPRADYVAPVIVGVAAALLFFFFQKDLGPALFLCCVFLAMYAVARGRLGMAIAGLLLLAAGFYLGYRLHVSATLAERVRMWLSPWDNAASGGNQIAHAMWAMATGGTFGTGLGLGDTRYLPAGHTDLILAAIGEETGAMGLVAVTLLFGVVAWRGLRVARTASGDYGFFLATALTLFLILPALIMAAGVMGVTPLTGVVTPFLSYGGSAMLANFAALGILASIHASKGAAADFEPFRVPLTCLSGVLGVCALALVAVAIRIQVVQADALAVRPHLGIQADGGRRLEYNPRILDLARSIPRGSIHDRNGLPLATGDPAALAAARQKYEKLGLTIGALCADPVQRCYPLGSRAYHLIGDARTRLNWSASNTSFVEREADGRLQGFDDHAAHMPTTTASGQPMFTIQRDYRDLLPALRHRYDAGHPAVVALRSASRDVRLTIDAGLQLRLAAIVQAYARRAQGRAAAVVIDPDTGALLASVSYPWPAMEAEIANDADGREALLDRARYGVYPPGSTFKLVVALAALRQPQGTASSVYNCGRLPDGRVGAAIRGWGRPIRDDVLDTRPHGSIGMHDAMVHSCNAYFAQLAVALGPEPLLDTAGRFRIRLARESKDGQGGGPIRRVAEAMPQVGYGQAQVVASPLRMASVAATIAASGVLREPYVDQAGAAAATPAQVLSAGAARLLGTYMRDVVVGGTGRSLRGHPLPIAGKTGTAEVSGEPSHSWFVGFAPFGQASRRVAFAIVVENAGYGGGSAAAAAGEIVTAAAAAGLIAK
jgi:cell division protein FtsW (lipid II flippase)